MGLGVAIGMEVVELQEENKAEEGRPVTMGIYDISYTLMGRGLFGLFPQAAI